MRTLGHKNIRITLVYTYLIDFKADEYSTKVASGAEDYDGPSGLLRKGARFRAVAEIYGREGNWHIWVKEVVEVHGRR